jgi:DHA2 family lincomycin resistance protein-like MFS transporter
VCTVLGEKRIKKLPVLDGGRLVGTISRSDVNRSLMSAFLQAA